MTLFLYSCYLDCGRMGNLDGLFVATEDYVKLLIDETINFGEVLGKHSDVDWTFEEGDIKKVDVSQSVIEELINALGREVVTGVYSISGINPLAYYFRVYS